MNVQYKKLLPKTLQTTRWGELIEALQAVTDQIRTEKIDAILNQYYLDEMTDAEILQMCSSLGYVPFYADGFCKTTEYLKRQLLTIIPRILERNNTKGYQYIAQIYNLNAKEYPTYNETKLIPILTWDTNPESDVSAQTLDMDLTLDSTEFVTLDAGNLIDNMTRHILFTYRFNDVEVPAEFMSDNMFRALYNDIIQHKRRTEIVYFEPCIEVTGNKLSTIQETTWYTYDNSEYGIAKCITYTPDLSSGSFIHLGNSSHNLSNLNSGTITDVYDFQYHLNVVPNLSSGEDTYNCDTLLSDVDNIHIRKYLYQKQRLQSESPNIISSGNIEFFSELALFDASSGLMMYAEFPLVRMGFKQSQLYNNIAVKINLI